MPLRNRNGGKVLPIFIFFIFLFKAKDSVKLFQGQGSVHVSAF